MSEIDKVPVLKVSATWLEIALSLTWHIFSTSHEEDTWHRLGCSLIFYNEGEFYIFLVAITECQEKVYNFLYQISGHKVFLAIDWMNGDNALHLAGRLAPSHRLNKITGAALQMQRELQWFKVILTVIHTLCQIL